MKPHVSSDSSDESATVCIKTSDPCHDIAIRQMAHSTRVEQFGRAMIPAKRTAQSLANLDLNPESRKHRVILEASQ